MPRLPGSVHSRGAPCQGQCTLLLPAAALMLTAAPWAALQQQQLQQELVVAPGRRLRRLCATAQMQMLGARGCLVLPPLRSGQLLLQHLKPLLLGSRSSRTVLVALVVAMAQRQQVGWVGQVLVVLARHWGRLRMRT